MAPAIFAWERVTWVKSQWKLYAYQGHFSVEININPIEMTFAKLKALIRKAAARTYDQLWKAVGQVCDLFKEEECYNFFTAAGYETE